MIRNEHIRGTMKVELFGKKVRQSLQSVKADMVRPCETAG